MNNYNIFKNYCREYLECAAVLNYLKKQDDPDINHMNNIISKMDELERKMFTYIKNKGD